jgi:hypothetical protein
MPTMINELHFAELEDQGYTVLRALVWQEEIRRFEQQIEALTSSQLLALKRTPVHRDPFIDVFSVGGPYTSRLYQLLERLAILQEISQRIGATMAQAGFFDWSQMTVPLVWPDIRADIPGDADQLLPVHQDYGSMLCETAYRLWIPLRPSNAETGTMCVYPGTHKQGPVTHDLSDPLRPKLDQGRYSESEKIVFDLPAGDGVLINPLLFHASVPNRSDRTKFTLMVQLQDFATMINPQDEQSHYGILSHVSAVRAAARAARV